MKSTITGGSPLSPGNRIVRTEIRKTCKRRSLPATETRFDRA